jgi:hypothetical protein
LNEQDTQFKLIRADFMVSKSHLEKISEEVKKACKKGIRLTKSKIVRLALDQFFLEGSKPDETVITDRITTDVK